MALTSDNINIGSGELFLKEITTSFPMPTSTADWLAIEQEANRLSHIKNGATLSYAATYYDAKDDLNMVQKTISTEENVTFKAGLMTFEPATFERICSTATPVTGTVGTGKTEVGVEIGGMQRFADRKWALLFKSVDQHHYLYGVAQSKTSFDIAFQPGQETVIDAEFAMLPELSDANGKKYCVRYTDIITA